MTNRLTSEVVAAFLKSYLDPADARRFLQEAGLIDENGELAKPYRTDEPAVSDDRESASVDASLSVRVQRLEQLRETERAALLDAFEQIDKLKQRLDFHYGKIHRIEEAITTIATEFDAHF